MERSCTKCGALRQLSDFRFNKSRDRHSASCRECENAYQRAHYWENPDKAREKAVRHMRATRAIPERRAPHLEKRRAYYHSKGKYGEQAYYARLKESDPWLWRVRNLRRNINPAITIEWLRSLWEAQRGHCALTGRALDIRTAELDHVIPRARNGSDDLDNLRLTVPEANAAKGALTDQEFVSLCQDVLRETQIPELIGRAIGQAMLEAA